MTRYPADTVDDARIEDLVQRVHGLVAAAQGNRVLLGIAGAPGSGKTCLAQALTDQLRSRYGAPAAAHVPMDGFHLADVELARLGRSDRKGAPDTFDAGGYLALLTRLRGATQTVYAPAFDRELEQPIAGSIPVEPEVRVVVSEGNYLLMDEPEWRRAREVFDEVWFTEPHEAERRKRLIARHIRFGKSPEAARAWALGPDERNAALITTNLAAADLVLRGDIKL